MLCVQCMEWRFFSFCVNVSFVLLQQNVETTTDTNTNRSSLSLPAVAGVGAGRRSCGDAERGSCRVEAVSVCVRGRGGPAFILTHRKWVGARAGGRSLMLAQKLAALTQLRTHTANAQMHTDLHTHTQIRTHQAKEWGKKGGWIKVTAVIVSPPLCSPGWETKRGTHNTPSHAVCVLQWFGSSLHNLSSVWAFQSPTEKDRFECNTIRFIVL